MLHRNHCRVVITDDCNLSCDFCCMKDKEIYDSFVTASPGYVATQQYDEVCITGGEPLLVLPKVIQFAALVRYFNPDVKIYLYTNGRLLTKNVAKFLSLAGIDSISISLHDFSTCYNLFDFSYIHCYIMPIRILVGEHEESEKVVRYAEIHKMDMRVWKMDDCFDMPEEDRYRIDWNII